MSKDEKHDGSLSQDELRQINGGRFKRNGVIPGYVVPTVLYDDGINILTTSHGVMTGRQARKQGFGGELLCNVY